jgi:hypothetical protein
MPGDLLQDLGHATPYIRHADPAKTQGKSGLLAGHGGNNE